MPGESPLNPPLPARKRSSLRKFLLWAGLILAGLFVARFVVGIGQSVYWFTTFSHSRIYQNQTLAEVKNRGAVVRPLIDEHQTFNIAVSIWVLPVGQDGERTTDIAEMPIYSDIVFRGLRLGDKHKDAIIPYRLPVSVFQRLLLKQDDLRASFVAIPDSPSLVDYVSNFSTWRPETMKTPSVRSWPFPLETADVGPQDIADKALDSFGISIPLLEFHEIHSNCANDSSFHSSQKAASQQQEENDDDEEDDDPDDPEELDETGNPFLILSDAAKHPQHAVKRHPFVVTRTQLRIVDEVHIFNRKAYNKEHNTLKSISCGQDLTVPDHSLCRRSYHMNGNWETRLELRVPDETTGELHTEWAYAPFMGHGSFSAGPKDLIPLPVTREICEQPENTPSNDPEFIDVEWQLSYSGRSPAKFFVTELFPHPQRVKHQDSEYKKAKAHDTAELWNGLYGHRFYEDAHPRRRMIIGVLASMVSFVLAVLDIGYWYTRTSTAFISVSGTVLIALSGIISALAHIANAAESDKLNISTSNFLRWFWLISITLATQFSLPFFMLKAVTRLEVGRDTSSWVPSVRLVSPTHKERNSQRLDSRTSWGVKAAVCISLISIYYFVSPDEYHVISGHLPSPGPEDYPINSIARVYGLIFFPLEFTGRLSQLLMNQRSKTFAGSYKISIILRCILMGLAMAIYSPSVVGRFDARPGFSAPQMVSMITLAAMVWQAVTLPKAAQKAEDDDIE